MSKIKLLNKGDVILTNPKEGFYGIAVVLSEDEGSKELYPRCHIFVTSLIFTKEINFSDLNIQNFELVEFEREYTFELEKRKRQPFKQLEKTIYTYTRRNKTNIKVIGNINPELIYNGELPFEPQILKTGIRIVGCGDPENKYLGREAYLNWEKLNKIKTN